MVQNRTAPYGTHARRRSNPTCCSRYLCSLPLHAFPFRVPLRSHPRILPSRNAGLTLRLAPQRTQCSTACPGFIPFWRATFRRQHHLPRQLRLRTFLRHTRWDAFRYSTRAGSAHAPSSPLPAALPHHHRTAPPSHHHYHFFPLLTPPAYRYPPSRDTPFNFFLTHTALVG